MPAPEVETIIAPNPGPMTLEGTNTYLVGRDPAVVIDPGPADEGHIEAVRAAAAERGGIDEVLLTHSHGDHADGVSCSASTPTELGDGESAPRHQRDRHPGPRRGPRLLSDRQDRILFAGDLILGEGSTIVPPAEQGGSLGDYMDSLRRVAELDLELIYPGHGPVIADPAAKIAEYIAAPHRARGPAGRRRWSAASARARPCCDEVWDDVPEELLPAAAYAMQAHLEKLEAEGRLPEGDRSEASIAAEPA